MLPEFAEASATRSAPAPATRSAPPARFVPFTIDQLNDRERGHVELALRDLAIRSSYPGLRASVGQSEALATLAELYSLSESSIKKVLWKS